MTVSFGYAMVEILNSMCIVREIGDVSKGSTIEGMNRVVTGTQWGARPIRSIFNPPGWIHFPKHPIVSDCWWVQHREEDHNRRAVIRLCSLELHTPLHSPVIIASPSLKSFVVRWRMTEQKRREHFGPSLAIEMMKDDGKVRHSIKKRRVHRIERVRWSLSMRICMFFFDGLEKGRC